MKKSWMKSLVGFALVMCAGLSCADVVTSFGVNFTRADDENITPASGFGFSKEGYTAPVNWTNVRGSTSGTGTVALDDGTAFPLAWTAKGTWNSGIEKSSDVAKLLYGYLDDVVVSGRTKATVTITGLPENRKYAVALILSGDGDNSDNFNNRYSPVLINTQTYSYVVSDSVTNLVIGEEAAAATTWGNRGKSASQAGELLEGLNVMFVEGLSGTNLTITSAMDSWNVSRLTIAGVQVWITDEFSEEVSGATIAGSVDASNIQWSGELSVERPVCINASEPATVNLDETIEAGILNTLGASITFTGDGDLSFTNTVVNADTDVSAIKASLGDVSVALGQTLTIGTNAVDVLTSFSGEGTLKFVGGTAETPLESELYGIKTEIGGTKESPSYLKVKGAALSANRVHKVIGNGPDASYFICEKDGPFGLAEGTEIKNVTMVHANSDRQFWWERGDFSGTILRVDAGVTMNHAFSPEFAGLEGSGAITAYAYASSDARTFTLNTSSDNRITSYGGVLSGNTHSVKVKGSGVQVFTGVNTYAAGTTVESGTLRLTGDGEVGSGAVTVAEGATFELRDGVVITNDIALAGNLKVTSGRGIVYGSISGNGTITVDGEGSVLGIGMVGYDDFTGSVVLTNKGAIVVPAGFETNHTITVEAGCMLSFRLNSDQMFNGYTATQPEGVTVRFYSDTGTELDTTTSDGKVTFAPDINIWERGKWQYNPREGEPVLILVSEDYTEPVNLNSEKGAITLGAVKIEGIGSVSFTGAKLTATSISISTILSASEDASITLTANPETLALGPMSIGERATVDYTFTSESDENLPVLSGEGTFVKRGTALAKFKSGNTCSTLVEVHEGTLLFDNAQYDDTYKVTVKEGATLQVGTWAGSLHSNDNVFNFEGGAKLKLANGNHSYDGSGVNATVNIESEDANPVVFEGSNSGNNTTLQGVLTGVGTIKIVDANDNYFTIASTITDGEDGKLKLKVVTDRGVKLSNSANTYSGGTEVAEGGILMLANPTALGTGPTTINGTLQLQNIALGSKVSGSGTITNTTANATVSFTGDGAIVPTYDSCLTVGGSGANVKFDVSSLLDAERRFDLFKVNSAADLPARLTGDNFVGGAFPKGWMLVPVKEGFGWAMAVRKFFFIVR